MAQYKMKRLGELSSQGSALASPMDSEAQALQEKQAQISAVKAAELSAAAPAVVPTAPAQIVAPPINAHAQYGDRPQERRIDVNSMLTPLGSARAKGGPVEADEPYVVGEEGPEVIVPDEDGEVVPNEGAPADFGGPVYANSNHVKPKLDTENPDIPEASIGMDTSNPAPAQVIPGQPQEGAKGSLSSAESKPEFDLSGRPFHGGKPSPYGTATGTPSMKPLGGAHEAAAQQKAAQDVDVAKQRDLIEQDKKAAAAKGPAGIMDLGIASIHEDVLNKTHPPAGIPAPLSNGKLEDGKQGLSSTATEEETRQYVAGLPGTATPEERNAAIIPPAPSTEGLPTSSRTRPDMVSQAPNAEGLPTTTNTNPGLGNANVIAPTAGTEHSALEQKRAALKATMEGPDTEAAGKAMRQLAELNKNNPYGSAGNHPGIGGKILHGLAKAGNIAGNIAAPGTMANIPGTDMNMQRQQQQGIAEEAQGAEINKDDAAAKAAGVAKPVPNEGKTITTDKGIMQFNPQTSRYDIPAGQPVETAGKTITNDQGIMQWNPETSKYDIPAGGAPAGHENDKSKYLDQYYKDHPEIPRTSESMQVPLKEFAKANQGDPQMLLMEPGAGGIQTATKVSPGTSVSSNAAKPGESAKEAGKHYLYTDETGTTHMDSGDKVPPDADKIPVKDPQVLMALAHSSNIVQESLNKLHKDVDEHPELFDSAKTRAILATALDDERAKSIGMLVAGTGGNLTMPAGVNKIIDTFLENNAVKGPEKAALQGYIADYWNMRDKAMVQQMAMQGGKIGRGSQAAMQNIIDQLPGGRTASSIMAKQQLAGVQQTQSELSGNYPDTYGNFTKVKPYEYKVKSSSGLTGHKVGGTITQGGRTYTVTSVDENGKVTGAK